MSSFLAATTEFIDAIAGKKAWVEELNALSHQVGDLIPEATDEEIEAALRRYAALFPNVPLVALGLVAINCGSLIENGGDPAIVGPALLERLPRINETVTEFYRHCRDAAIADAELLDRLRAEAEDGTEAESLTPAALLDEQIASSGWHELAMTFGPTIFPEHPAAVLGHMSEEFFRLGLIAHLSRSKSLRAAACANSALLDQTRLADDAAGTNSSFLVTMLRVLDAESLLVLHVPERRGYEVTISGLADNFQLHTLLAGAIIGRASNGWVSGEAPSRRAIAECRDTLPPATGGADVTGAFNLWNWTGLRRDGALPESQSTGAADHWIWNEGCPADIRPFDGRRIVLLGPPPYQRHWRAGRQFAGMRGELSVDRTLPFGEVDEWLTRLATAPRG